jgi:hypothetical protein
VRRNKQGEFSDVVDVGKSLSQDRKRKAKTVVKSGEGDRGDQKPRAKKTTAKRAGAKRATTRKTGAKKVAASRAKAKRPTARPRSKKKTLSKARGRTKR